MPSRNDTRIHTRNGQGCKSPSDSSAVVGDQDPTYTFGSEEGEIVQCVSTRMTGKAWNKDLMKEVEDFVESVRKEVAQAEARKFSATVSRERRPARVSNHPDAGMGVGDADTVPRCTQRRQNKPLTLSDREIF